MKAFAALRMEYSTILNDYSVHVWSDEKVLKRIENSIVQEVSAQENPTRKGQRRHNFEEMFESTRKLRPLAGAKCYLTISKDILPLSRRLSLIGSYDSENLILNTATLFCLLLHISLQVSNQYGVEINK